MFEKMQLGKETLLKVFKASEGNCEHLKKLWEEQVAKTPEQVALEIGNELVTYKELDQKSHKLAAYLAKKGANANTRAGVLMNYSQELVVSLLACLKLGVVYVPIDPAYPEERISFMISDSNMKYLLTQKEIEMTQEDVERICVDELAEVLQMENASYNENVQEKLCIIYTSGTTGKPKGVEVPVKGISNYIAWRSKKYQINQDDRILELISISFDGFLSNFYTALLNGARLVMPEASRWRDFGYITEIIKEKKVTHMSIVPLMYKEILNNMNDGALDSVRSVVLAGERADEKVLQLSSEKAKNIVMINEYGPSECSVAIASNVGMRVDNANIIGEGIDNHTLYILVESDEEREPVRGELCVSGTGLCNGYLGNEELTAAKFITNPFDNQTTIYRTGDIVEWKSDGRLKYIGRNDNQIKINGNRVEIEEIKKVILESALVEAVEIVLEINETGYTFLDAYLVSNKEFSDTELVDIIVNKLPSYMVPANYYHVEEIPMNENGKVSIEKLREYKKNIVGADEICTVDKEIEDTIYKIWVDKLKKEDLPRNRCFFEIGGNSMLIMEMQMEIDKLYPGILTIPDLFKYKTIQQIAMFIEKGLKNKEGQQLTELFLPEADDISNVMEKKVKKIVLNNVEKDNIEKLCISESISEDIFFESIFATVIAKIYKRNILSMLRVAENQKEKIGVTKVDFEQCDKFNDIFAMVNSNAIYVEICEVANLLTQYENTISYAYQDNTQNNCIKEIDVVLRREKEQDNYTFEIQYNNGKMEESLVEKISLTYQNAVEKICSLY